MGFFDDYPRFFETSRTGTTPNRLNKRHQAIFRTRPEIFPGARVLDIASHDGRWSLAALKAGASSVVGIEARPQLVSSAKENLRHYGFDAGRYRFVQADVFDWLQRADESFDVVLCLGFFYHTHRHVELLSLVAKGRPHALVLDTSVHRSAGAVCRVFRERVASDSNAVEDSLSRDGKAYVAWPSPDLVRDYLATFGFSVAEVDWTSLIGQDGDTVGVEDYSRGDRMTFIARDARTIQPGQ